jgi:hypothetical protein
VSGGPGLVGMSERLIEGVAFAFALVMDRNGWSDGFGF